MAEGMTERAIIETIREDQARLLEANVQRNDLITEMRRFKEGWYFDVNTLRSLSRRNPTPQHRRYASHSAALKVQFIVNVLDTGRERHRVPSLVQNPEEKEKAGRVERFFWGIWNEVDSREFGQQRRRWVNQVVERLATDGIVYTFPWLRTGGRRDELQFHCPVYDSLECFHETGIDGIMLFVRTMKVTPSWALSLVQGNRGQPGWVELAEHELRPSTGGKTVEMVEWWKVVDGEVLNAVLLNGKVARQMTSDGFDRIPVKVAAITTIDEDGNEIVNPFLRPALNSSVHLNEFLSDLMQVADLLARPQYTHTTATGVTNIRPTDFGRGKITGLKQGEELKLLTQVIQTQPMLDAIQLLRSEQQQHFSDVLFAMVPQPGSGFRFVQERRTAMAIFQPILAAGQFLQQECDMEFLHQFRKLGRPVLLSAQSVDGTRKGQYFSEEFRPSDIPDFHHIEVQWAIDLPSDPITAANVSRSLAQEPALLSLETIQEQQLEVEDVTLENRKIQEERVARLVQSDPKVVAFQLADGLMAMSRAMRFAAEREEDDARRAQLLERARVLELRAIAIERDALGGAERRGAPTPPNPLGVPPEVLPPEFFRQAQEEALAAANVPPNTNPRRVPEPGQAIAEQLEET